MILRTFRSYSFLLLAMALRNLVEDQCGGPNSLVQLTSHFVQDRGLTDQGLLHPFQHKSYPDQDTEVRMKRSSPYVEYHMFILCYLLIRP